MNAGAYGGELKDIIESVTFICPDGLIKTETVDNLDLGYRHSCIPDREYVVVEAEFTLSEKPEEEIRERMQDLAGRRREKQPLEYPSAGSTFKRPEGYYAGKLIMDAGLRGFSCGGAEVSEKHCGFVINKGGATARDVMQLIEDVRQKVYDRFQVELEPEVRLTGEK